MSAVSRVDELEAAVRDGLYTDYGLYPDSPSLKALRELAAIARDGQQAREWVDRVSAMSTDAATAAEAAEARADKLAEALAWYAERRNYMPPAGITRPIPGVWIFEHDAFDGEGPGSRARAALAGEGQQ